MAGKPTGYDTREVRVVIFMTEKDAEFMKRLADSLGFKSRSGFITAMLERFIEGGFSVLSFALVGMQLQKQVTKRKIPSQGFYLGKPKSLLPELKVEDLTAKQRRVLENAEKAFHSSAVTTK